MLCGTSAIRHIHVCSDLHTESPENRAWIDSLRSSTAYRQDCLIVAGDVSDSHSLFCHSMETLRAAFGVVFFVCGNHDLWTRRDGSEGDHSLEKLERLEAVCDDLGILTTPQRIAMRNGPPVTVTPLLSFHHTEFDSEPDIAALRLPRVQSAVTDFRACRWPSPLATGGTALAEHFDGLNHAPFGRAAVQAAAACVPALTPLRSWDEARAEGARLLSFSHFLPFIELCPEKRFLQYPDLMKAVGSLPLGRRVSALRPDCHVFGHTHFGWDGEIDGIRFVQAALATPRERRRRMRSLQIGGIQSAPLQLYDGDEGDFVGPRSAAWSSYYVSNARTPEITQPAPYVLAYYRTRAPSRIVDRHVTQDGQADPQNVKG